MLMDKIMRLIVLCALGVLLLSLFSIALRSLDRLIALRRCKPDENGRFHHKWGWNEKKGMLVCRECGRPFDPGPYRL